MPITATSTHATKVKAAPLEPALTKGVLGDILIARRDLSLLCTLPSRQPRKYIDEPATHVSPQVERDPGARRDEDTGEEGPGRNNAEESDVDIFGGSEVTEHHSAGDLSPQQRCSTCVTSSRNRGDGARRSFPPMGCCREERIRQYPASSVDTASSSEGTHGATDSGIHPRRDLTDAKGASGVSTAKLGQMMQSRRCVPRSASTNSPHPVANASKSSGTVRTEFIANIVQLHHGATSDSQTPADGKHLSASGDNLRPKDFQCGIASVTGKSEERTVTVLVGLLSHDTLQDRGLALSSLFLSDETGKRGAGVDVPNARQSLVFFAFDPTCHYWFQYLWMVLTCRLQYRHAFARASSFLFLKHDWPMKLRVTINRPASSR